MSGSSFGGSLATLFSPMGAEFNLAQKHPQAEVTVQNITIYQQSMEELRGESGLIEEYRSSDSH